MNTRSKITAALLALATFTAAPNATAHPLAERYADAIKEIALTPPNKQQDFESFCRLIRETFDLEYMTSYVEKEAGDGLDSATIGQNLVLGFIAAWALYKMDFLKEQREKRATLAYVPVGESNTRAYASVKLVKFKVRNTSDAGVSQIYVGANGKIHNFGNKIIRKMQW